MPRADQLAAIEPPLAERPTLVGTASAHGTDVTVGSDEDHRHTLDVDAQRLPSTRSASSATATKRRGSLLRTA
ncbi:MAG: hypothetical protein M3Q22_14365 [Actinomycetota bacterium]|nr:hypothetical protein [Actinomycetota bacterium]